ncbi:uncharacterized protein LOC143568203 [Bidens hawaiensis]|uniref:uncharacterized protein LOC143568203 n=1 Tax=Bidens hawaiensis TaxID=980011 RepID=UPI0040491D39
MQAVGNTNVASAGQRVILPSSFTGGARYIIQNYLDAMCLCRWFGYPDFFITVTCNPNWPEVKRFLKDTTLNSEDRPDILCRLFKLKLDAMIKLVKDKFLFGRVQAGSKIHNPKDVDKFISAEIPNKDSDPDLYKLVSDHMIHGPCGDANPKCTCMVNKRCSKIFNDETTVDSNGFPVYKRRDNGQYVVKSDIMMDNRTGPDRATISLVQNNNGDNQDPNVDEIKAFYDCRYDSACEAAWRIFAFGVHYRLPSVMRLAFHLPGEQQVIYGANEDIEDILNKTTNASSMFTGWFECNKKYDLAKTLTYAEFPTKYVWKKQGRKWEPRQRGFAIGRVHAVPAAFDEAYYLRILLNKVKGPECFEDIRTVDGVVCETFRDACYKRGLLDNDKEYIEAIEEVTCFFVYGYGGTRKTYLWKTLSASIRSKRDVVLNVASSGIASLLLDGGRTAHSRFLIPINLTEDSICPDEAPMIHKHAFEALDRTLNDVINGDSANTSEALFGALFPGEEVQYLSSDSLAESEDVSDDVDPQLYSPNLLNGLKMSGMPNHKLVLKVGVPIMLLRNINHKKGLCNGTRLQVVSLGRRVIEAKVFSELDMLKLSNHRKKIANLELEREVSLKVKWLAECANYESDYDGYPESLLSDDEGEGRT